METDQDGSTMRAEAVRLIADPRFLSVMFIAAIVPTSVAVVSPALPRMATDLGVSDARIGLVMTAITLPPMILAPFVGSVSDMYGRRTVAVPGLFLFWTVLGFNFVGDALRDALDPRIRQ